MSRFSKSKLLAALALIVFSGLAGTWAVGTVGDKYEVAKMTEGMKTVCVGRFLIDLPHDARIELSLPRIDGFDIKTYGETDTQFLARLAARETKIRAKPDRFGGNNNLESVREVRTDSGLAGKIFLHSRTVTEGTRARGLELERYRYQGIAVEALVHANGVSIDLAADDYDVDHIEDLPRLVAKAVANPSNHIPAEPGFCIDRAYFRDPLTADQGEQIKMSADLPSYPDIAIWLDSAAGLKPPEQGLLERNAANSKRRPATVSMRFTKLRATPRTIGGLTGDELVERVIEENFTIVYGFRWEVLGTENDVLVPELTLKMVTGRSHDRPISSSLSQDAAVALWDKISSSIRVRPTQAPKVNTTGPATQLGAFASAGDTCPADGWWECSAGRNGVTVHGGQRQYIRQGQRMPQALLLPQQTLWEKVRGLQSSYEDKNPTPWRLVDRRSQRRVVPDVPLAQATAAAPAAASAVAGAGAIERASVGIYAITGHVCPASGWWQCQESDALDGTRWFAQGSQLPAATFAVPARGFGRTPDRTTAVQRCGTWQLVRLAQAPEAARMASESRDSTTSPTGPDTISGQSSG